MNRLKKLAAEDIPQVLYHATFNEHLNSIMQSGLGANVTTKSFDWSKDGVVYLANDPDVAASYAEVAEDVPEEWLEEDIIVLKIDTTSLDKSKFFPDEHVDQEDSGSYEYHGVIPPNAITIMN